MVFIENIVTMRAVTMLQFYLILLISHLLILVMSSGRKFGEKDIWEIPFFDRFQQHDYEMKFERTELVRCNTTTVKYAKIVTYKFNRACPLTNSSMMFNIDFGNNLQSTIQVYKFASNEYRTFPIHFQFNFCESFKKDIAGFKSTVNCGSFKGCPLVTNYNYTICKWAPDPAKFPPSMPNGQFMLEIQTTYHSAEVFVYRMYYIIFRPVPILD